jgi:hypothetical protein
MILELQVMELKSKLGMENSEVKLNGQDPTTSHPAHLKTLDGTEMSPILVEDTPEVAEVDILVRLPSNPLSHVISILLCCSKNSAHFCNFL